MDALTAVAEEVGACRACPRLVAWREEVARVRRAAYRDEAYWGRGVPGFGDPDARVMLVGLAPAAHGANRTGRMFTGDRSGDFLFASLHRVGLASQPSSRGVDDGLVLRGAYVTAAVRCAPPGNQPLPDERERCRGYLERELELLAGVRAIVALGGFAYQALAPMLGVRPRPRFAHGLEVPLADGRRLLCTFHPSQQNTFTGRLTEAMLDDVLGRAAALGAAAG